MLSVKSRFLGQISFAIAALLLVSVASFGQGSESELGPGASSERNLTRNEFHSYWVALRAGEFMHVRVNVWGLEIGINVFDPDDRQLLSEKTDGLDAKRIFLLAEKTGKYRLKIGGLPEGAPHGCYEVKVVALGAVSGEDRKRLEAQSLKAEAKPLLDRHTAETLREAIGKYQSAVRLWKALGDREGEGQTLHDLGIAYYYLGEKRKALALFTDAQPLLRAVGNRAVESRVLNDLGVISQDIGELPDALKYYEQALHLRRVLLRDRQLESPRMEAVFVYHIGVVQRDLGEYQKALDSLRQSLPLWETWSDGQAYSLYGVATVYARLGEAQQALDYFGQALAIRRKLEEDPHFTGNKVAVSQRATETLVQIGAVYASVGQWPQALENYELALARARNEKFSEVEARALNKMGAAYLALGDYQKALESFTRSLAEFKRVSDSAREADTLRGIGEISSLTGAQHKALELFGQALQIQRVVGDQLGEASTAFAMARASRELGQLEQARDQIESALNLIESLRGKITSHEMRASYRASKQDYYEFYVELLMLMDTRRPASGYAALALQASERARARSLLDTLGERRADIRQGIKPELLENATRLRQALDVKSERLTRLLSSKHDELQATVAKQEFANLVTEYRELEARIRASSPRYASLTQPVPSNLSDIQTQVLDDETLLLEYALGERKSFVWAVTRTSIRGFELPGRGEIEVAARRVYEMLGARNTKIPNETPQQKRLRVDRADTEYPEAAARLSQIILEPVASEFTRKRLLIVADGALQYVPIGALPKPSGVKQRLPGGGPGYGTAMRKLSVPLIVDHEVVSLPSASVLTALRQESAYREPATKIVAVLADPVFEAHDSRVMVPRATRASQHRSQSLPADVLRSAEESGLKDFVRLRFSRAEAEAITSLVPERQTLKAVDFAASRSTATSDELRQYRIVHFATHGLINSHHPELSGLVLSLVDEQSQRQNGFLRLYDIYNLHLRADLVVLSACQTALGKEIKGEGLVGLTRGFMYAGAPRVVASLWQIDDRATAELMKRFYRGLLGKQKLSAAAALRAAQLEMRQEKGWENPYFWAAFTLQGEWR